ncbi:MAG: replication initiation protein [Thiolinea sp.]
MTINNQMVTMSNMLTRAAYTLSLSEKRLLMLAVTHLDKMSDESQILTITSGEYAAFYALHQKGAYRTLKNATENLWSRTLVADDNTKYRWIITSKYEDGVIEIEFHPRLRPHLIQLQNQFTQYFLHRAADFKLMYTWRLFELIMQFKSTGYLKVELNEFKKILDIPEAYDKDFGKIREKVIAPAITEIKEKDGLKVTWKPIKTGRKVTALEFKFPVEHQNPLVLIDNTYIEKHARPGESYEQAHKRLKQKLEQ